MSGEGKLVTAHELAEQLGLSVETIWRYTRNKRIPYIEIGNRQYRYSVDEVMASLASGKREVTYETLCAETPAEYGGDRVFTYSDYLKLPDDELYRYEVLEGMLVREPAPTTLHQRVSRKLQRLLEDYFWQQDPAGEVFNAPIDLTLSEINVIQPDLVYVPGDSPIVEEKRLNGIPKLIVEVISPSSHGRDRIKKLRIYSKAGIPHYWIVNPEMKTIEAYALSDNGEYAIRSCAAENESLEHPDFPGLVINLDDLWKKGRL